VIEIPGYTILGRIGQGGMASVYRARQVMLDRDVALKVMSSQLAQDDAYAQRFLQEARMLATLNHPNVVQVYDVGVTPAGLHYFSMAMLPGGDFAQRMREGMNETELLRVLVATATALGFAHARGYVHRDVTPGNILFDAHGTPVLTDFGIARAVSAVSRLTSSGMSVGTSHYMSPEQARGSPDIDHRADIYGLGVLCYEAVVGEPPFNGEDSFAVAFAHVNDPVPRLPEEVARWQPLIDKAMAKRPDDRYQTCAEFIDALREIAPTEFATLRPLAAPPPPGSTPPPPTRRRRGAAASSASRLPWFAGGGLALILLGGGLWWWLSGSEQPAPTPAPPAVVAAPKPPPSTPASVDPDAQEAGLAQTIDETPDEIDGMLMEDEQAALELALAQTVRDPVAALLEAGRANIAANRLTSPPVTNAFERFKLALVIEPGNADAARGIASVAQAYVDLAAPLVEAADAARFIEYLQLAESVATAHPQAAEQARAARTLRERRAQGFIARGDKAVKDFDRDAAVAAYGEALAVAPGLAAAERGLAAARKVGTPGYAFRDALSGGGQGPEMVVVANGRALGKHEVTRGEFAAYWTAAGNRQFGNDLPGCRDRNSGALFGGSKRRTWQSPDIEQTDRHPVVCVSYAMADAYVAWMSQRSGQRYRLPKAAELTPFAPPLVADCRGNLRDVRGGCQDGHAGTAPVGSYAARPPGLFDTVGNVSEWTSDCERDNCRERIAIGGNWYSEAGEPIRQSRTADSGFNTVGFRLLREIDP